MQRPMWKESVRYEIIDELHYVKNGILEGRLEVTVENLDGGLITGVPKFCHASCFHGNYTSAVRSQMLRRILVDIKSTVMMTAVENVLVEDFSPPVVLKWVNEFTFLYDKNKGMEIIVEVYNPAALVLKQLLKEENA